MSVMVEAFFFGLYMDDDLLVSLGFKPLSVKKAKIDSYKIDLFGSAKIVPKQNSVVWGNVIELRKQDLEAMYSFEATKAYSPNLVQITDLYGSTRSVSCYNLPETTDEPFNRDYQEKLISVLKKHRFPAEYVKEVEELDKTKGPSSARTTAKL